MPKSRSKKPASEQQPEKDRLLFSDSNVQSSSAKDDEISVNEEAILYVKETKPRTASKRTSVKPSKEKNSPIAEESANPATRELNAFSKTFFLELHAQNIGAVFTSGIIAPARYITNRAFSDIQTTHDSVLSVSDKYYSIQDPNTALISVSLWPQEIGLLNYTEEGIFFPGAIPISRIVQIHFANPDIAKTIKSQLRSENAGFLPDWMIEDITLSEQAQEGIEPGTHAAVQANVPNLSKQLQRFDQILGAFAYIKNMGVLTADQSGILTSLPTHFFYMAQAANSVNEFAVLKKDSTVKFYKQLFGLEPADSRMVWFIRRLGERRNFTGDDSKQYGSDSGLLADEKIEPRVLDGIFSKLNDPTKFRDALEQIGGLNPSIGFYLYLFAFLRTFGSLTSEDVTTARKGAFPLLPKGDYGEIIVAFLGYFFGYTSMRNFEDKPTIKEHGFQQIAGGKRMTLKFDLDALLDSVIIESAYQVAFHDNALFSDVAQLPASQIQPRVNTVVNSIPQGYSLADSPVLLGTPVYTITKVTGTILPERIPVLSELGLYCWRKGIIKTYHLNYLLDGLDKFPYVICYTRDAILEGIERKQLDAQEVERRLGVSKQLDALE